MIILFIESHVSLLTLQFSFHVFKLFPIHRALVKSMGEILFMCGDNKRAVIATLNAVGLDTEGFAKNEVSCFRFDINVLLNISLEWKPCDYNSYFCTAVLDILAANRDCLLSCRSLQKHFRALQLNLHLICKKF